LGGAIIEVLALTFEGTCLLSENGHCGLPSRAILAASYCPLTNMKKFHSMIAQEMITSCFEVFDAIQENFCACLAYRA